MEALWRRFARVRKSIAFHHQNVNKRSTPIGLTAASSELQTFIFYNAAKGRHFVTVEAVPRQRAVSRKRKTPTLSSY